VASYRLGLLSTIGEARLPVNKIRHASNEIYDQFLAIARKDLSGDF
jgi:hypothetical protein